MNIADATVTKDGTPVQILKRLEDTSEFSWVGVFWNDQDKEWEPNRWDDSGKSQIIHADCENLDIDLKGWQKNIPWENLDHGIKAIARDFDGKWKGFLYKEVFPNHTSLTWQTFSSVGTPINGLIIPDAPDDWEETLAVRPRGNKKFKC